MKDLLRRFLRPRPPNKPTVAEEEVAYMENELRRVQGIVDRYREALAVEQRERRGRVRS